MSMCVFLVQMMVARRCLLQCIAILLSYRLLFCVCDVYVSVVACREWTWAVYAWQLRAFFLSRVDLSRCSGIYEISHQPLSLTAPFFFNAFFVVVIYCFTCICAMCLCRGYVFL